MAEFPALPLFTDAFISDTTHLNAAQTGAYLMLLMAAWRSPDCMLVDDDKLLARMARMDNRWWTANKEIVLSFWRVDPKTQKLYQRRLVDERKFVDDKRRSNVHAGKISALKRKERHSTDVPTEGQHKPNQPTPTPTPTPTVSKEDNPPLPPLPNIGFGLFEKFWDAFPRQRRGSRDKAAAAYKLAMKRTTEENIHEAAIRYSQCDDVRRGYAKGAAAWLNDDRFDDQHRTTQQASNGRGTYADSIGAAGETALRYLRETEEIRKKI